MLAWGRAIAPVLAASPQSDVAQAARLAVLIVRDDADASLASRLRRELAVWGWSVQEVSDTGSAPQALAALARQASAVAALRLHDGGSSIEIWVSDQQTGGTAIHEALSVRDSTASDVLAVRVAETLRARLVRLGLLESGNAPLGAPARRDVPAPAVTVHAPQAPAKPDAPSRLLFGAAPAVNWFPRGLGPMAQALTTVRINALPVWWIEAFATWPLASTRIDGVEGTADVSSRTVGLEAGWSKHVGAFEWGLGAGVGVAWLTTQGRDNASYVGQRTTLIAPAAVMQCLTTVRASRALRLRLDLKVGATLRSSVVRFGERDVARWGQPFALLSLGPELGFL